MFGELEINLSKQCNMHTKSYLKNKLKKFTKHWKVISSPKRGPKIKISYNLKGLPTLIRQKTILLLLVFVFFSLIQTPQGQKLCPVISDLVTLCSELVTRFQFRCIYEDIALNDLIPFSALKISIFFPWWFKNHKFVLF